MKSRDRFLEFSPSVAEAVNHRRPIIALESTIISHGMPYPQNLKMAEKLENIICQEGATPATICLMNGKIKVGLDGDELGILAKAENVVKVSSRDIGRVLISGMTGATTVASTLKIAAWAGIKVFATGGIGGVHRQTANPFDVSNDLIELARNPVIVVSAGAKAILDLSKTLEYLETFGVPVLGYQTNRFPAFYSVESEYEIDRIESAKEIVKIFEMNRVLDLRVGMLVANPIPQEAEIPFAEMDDYIQTALQKAQETGISGRKLTPFLLAEIVKLTAGRSLAANLKLVENNVRLACEIAKKL